MIITIRNFTPLKGIIFLIAVLSLFSCQMEQKISIDVKGQGEMSFSVELEDYLTTVMDQMQALSGPVEPEDEADVFDLEALKTDLNKRPELEVISLENSSETSWSGALKFSDVEKALASEDLPSGTETLISFSTSNGVSTLDVNFSLESFEAIMISNPSLDSPLMQAFGPLANEGLTNADYLDMMEFALGPESRMGISNSTLALVINVDGEIIEQFGGELIDNTSVKFSIPLLDILILDEELHYSVKFK